MTGRLSDLAEQVLKAAKRAGADAADTLVMDGTSISIEVRAGALEHAERSEGVDLGLRVLCGARQACVSISDDSATSIATMAERAVAMAREAPEDPTCGLATPDQLAQDWDVAVLDLYDDSSAPSPADLERMALEAEAAALAVDGVTQAQGAGSGYSETSLFLATSNGFRGGYQRGSYSTSCVAKAQQWNGTTTVKPAAITLIYLMRAASASWQGSGRWHGPVPHGRRPVPIRCCLTNGSRPR